MQTMKTAEEIYQAAIAAVGEAAVERLSAIGISLIDRAALQRGNDQRKLEIHRVRDAAEAAMRAAGATAMRVELTSEGDSTTTISVVHPTGNEAEMVLAILRLMYACAMVPVAEGMRCPTLGEVREALQRTAIHAESATGNGRDMVVRSDLPELREAILHDPAAVAHKLLTFVETLLSESAAEDTHLARNTYDKLRFLFGSNAPEFDELSETNKQAFVETARGAYDLGKMSADAQLSDGAMRVMDAMLRWLDAPTDAIAADFRWCGESWRSIMTDAPPPEMAAPEMEPPTPELRAKIQAALRRKTPNTTKKDEG